MTAFVILAAGPGTRMGRAGEMLHKALVPLGGMAVISHQIALAPPGARVIVATGYRAGQVRDYLTLAHPQQRITYVDVPGWDQPGGGPGASLAAAREFVGTDDLVFTSCDTLWHYDKTLWDAETSWAAVAPVPAGTSPDRWCRIRASATGWAQAIYDKTRGVASWTYTGLAMIMRQDQPAFWRGIGDAALLQDERQVTGGLSALIQTGKLRTQRVNWTDVGDDTAYQRAVAAWSGYDWTKTGQVTWVLPETGRVVKFFEDEGAAIRRTIRQKSISGAVPKLTGTRKQMLAYAYVHGESGYDAADRDTTLIPRLCDWAESKLWHPVQADTAAACMSFYKGKTLARISLLPEGLRETARHATSRINWDELATGAVPVTFHGDFNLGNIVATRRAFRGIDWREDFAGHLNWGDKRYDLAKLAAGMIVHWENARRGDFRPWPAGPGHLYQLARWLGGKEMPHDIMVIAALSLLSSAALHAPPLDAVLVARAVALLEELL